MIIGQLPPDYTNNIGGTNNLIPKADTQFSSILMQIAMKNSNTADSKQGLDQKYGKITYHTGDISTFSNWERNDFPVAELFKEHANIGALAKWSPTDKAIFTTGFEDSVQDSLKSISDGSRAVMIHPEIQNKMDHNPEYANEIYNKIDTYFQKDIMINESILPGCTQGIIQFVSIDSYGNIDKTCTLTNSVNRPESKNNTPVNFTNTVDASLLNEIKNTYGEENLSSTNYTVANPNHSADNYMVWGGIYSEVLKEKLLETSI